MKLKLKLTALVGWLHLVNTKSASSAVDLSDAQTAVQTKYDSLFARYHHAHCKRCSHVVDLVVGYFMPFASRFESLTHAFTGGTDIENAGLWSRCIE